MKRTTHTQESRKIIGGRLRALRMERGLTQETLAHKAGVGSATVYRMENGILAPSWEHLGDILFALDAPVSLATWAMLRFCGYPAVVCGTARRALEPRHARG